MPRPATGGDAEAPVAERLHIEAIGAPNSLYHWEASAHAHAGLVQVAWLSSGSVELAFDDRRDRAQAPAAVVVPPGVVHALQFAPRTAGWVLTLDRRGLVEGDEPGADPLAALLQAPVVLRVPDGAADAGHIGALLVALAREFGADPGSSVIGWLARAVVWRLARMRARALRSGLRNEALFARLVRLVDAHHAEHWPIGRYADRLGLSTERLNRLARAASGRSALELIHDRVAREACRRLRYTAAPVSQLAAELGFDDPAYFSRFFRRRVGVSPREFRETAGSAVLDADHPADAELVGQHPEAG